MNINEQRNLNPFDLLLESLLVVQIQLLVTCELVYHLTYMGQKYHFFQSAEA